MAFFSFTSWLKNMMANHRGTRRNKPRSAVRTIRKARLNVELLEDRVTPSTLATHALLEGPAIYNASVAVTTPGAWTATANHAWLHVTTPGGAGNGTEVFTLDANPGATRVGSLTIAGETLTVTQSGSTYVAAYPQTTFQPGIPQGNSSYSKCVFDNAGNLYFPSGSTIQKLDAATQTVSTVVSSGLTLPVAVAVDNAGNLFIADLHNNNTSVFKWDAAAQSLSVANPDSGAGMYGFTSLAVDRAGNLYISSFGGGVYECNTANPNGLLLPSAYSVFSVGADAAGNVYWIDATFQGPAHKFNPQTNVITDLGGMGAGYRYPAMAVDGAGNVYANGGSGFRVYDAATQTITVAIGNGDFDGTAGMAVDAAGNVYFETIYNPFSLYPAGLVEVPHTFVPTGPVSEYAVAGSDSLLPVMSTQTLLGQFAPTSDQSWLTIGSVAGDVVHFSFSQNTTGVSRIAHITVLGQQIQVTQTNMNSPPPLATASLIEGPAIGIAADAVTTTGAWTAVANSSWLHVQAGNSSGTGNGMAVFALDANPGATRVGTLTIAGETLTVTQAGSTYVAAYPLTFPVGGSSVGIATASDAAGNVYFPDSSGNIDVWNAATHTVSTLISGLPAPGNYLYRFATGVTNLAVDTTGDLYYCVQLEVNGNASGTVYEWNAATHATTTVVPTGILADFQLDGLAVDTAGNIYTSGYDAGVFEVNAAHPNGLDLLSSLGRDYLNLPVYGNGTPNPTGDFLTYGVAVDGAGNVYFSTGTYLANVAGKWNPSTQTISWFFPQGPGGMVGDGAGNLYSAAGQGGFSVLQWDAATQTRTPIASSYPFEDYRGAAVDASGDVDSIGSGGLGNGLVEIPRTFVPTGPVSETAAAGSDSLLPVMSTHTLLGQFAPTSDQSWLTIGSVAGDVVHFSFSQNTGLNSRTAHINVLGQSISVTQGPANSPPAIAVNAPTSVTVSEGSSATKMGTWSDVNAGDTVTLSASIGAIVKSGTNAAGAWSWSYTPAEEAAAQTVTITANDGTASTQTTFSLVVNDAALSAGALTPPGTGTPTVNFFANSGFAPEGVAVDASGNVYYTNYSSNTISKATPAGAVSTFLSLPDGSSPNALVFDAAGNLYVSRGQACVITKITFSAPGVFGGSSTFATTPTSPLSQPQGMAFDSAGNLYVALVERGVVGAGRIAKYNSSGGLINVNFGTGFNSPRGLAFDQVNNILYVTNTDGTTISKVTETGTAATTGAVSSFATGLSSPYGLTYGPGGNLYVANAGDNTIRKLTFSSPGVLGTQTTYVANTQEPSIPSGLAFDNSGNLYVGNLGDFNTNTGTISRITSPLLVEGQAFTNQVVFHFSDADPAAAVTDYTAVVTLGDGNTVTLNSAGKVSGPASANGQIVASAGGGFDVQLSYTYAEELTNATFSVSVADHNATTAASTSTFSVGDAPLTAGTVSAGGGVAGVTPTSLTATFTDANHGAPTSDFSGTIYWGDTTSTNFTSSAVTGGSYSVSGSHQYATAGIFNISVTINDVGGSSTSDAGTTTAAIVAHPGYWAPTGSAVEFVDPAGTYSPAGVTSPTTDPAGTYSGPGAASPTPAPAGTYIPTTGATDVSAAITDPAGTYSGPGAAAPTTDPAGTFSGPGAASPTTDPAGTYSGPGASSATTDPAGTYSGPGAASATTDPAGTYSAAGAATPTTDPPGTYSGPGASSATTDPAGTYSAAGAATPTTDPPGTYSAAGASSATTDPAGTYSAAGAATPTTDPPGTYSGPGASSATTDPAGTYSGAGAATPTIDPAGSYSAPGAASPTTDPAGTYSGPGAAAPTPAPAGTYIPITGATSVSATITDPAGTYSAPGAAGPTTDPAGTYSGPGAAAPTTDPAGTFSAPGAASPTPDPVGTYSGPGAGSPTPFPGGTLGTFTPTAGAPFSGTVASFTNTEMGATPASYTAQINWGDGSTSVGTITDNGGGTFLVSGSHTYAFAGTNMVTVTITHVIGNTTTAIAKTSAVVTNLGFGQTQDLDYWHKSTGQALINSFNGGSTATALSTWLAATYPNLYGAQAGSNNLTGKTNAQVAAFFQNLWSQHHVSVDMQTLTTALNVYASTLSLGGAAGEAAGFQVTTQGLGGSSYNVGNNGAAFGVANNTTLMVSQLLPAVNNQAVGGVLYSSNPSRRDPATDTLDKVNREGKVGIQDNQTQPVSFWHRDRGQDLITAFNGGPNSTALSSWLATNFSAMYGSGAGANNLTGMTNTQVATFFQSLWANHHDEADVQVLALALNVYATTQSLGGAAGQAAGFTVTAAGLGAASFNIGNAGAAAGVTNNTTLNVYDLLVAVNHQAVNGVLYNGNAPLRNLCEELNEAGQ